MGNRVLIFVEFIVGIAIPIVLLWIGVRISFFSVAIFSYFGFFVVSGIYLILGVVFGILHSKNLKTSKLNGLWLALPITLFLSLAIFSDPSPKEDIPRIVGLLSPYIAAEIGGGISKLIGKKNGLV